MINHHLQRCVIPHLLTEKRGINHLQVVNQVDPGCKGSNPSRTYHGRLTGTNLMVMMGVVNPLGVSTRGAQATTQIGDIMEADLGTWTENIIEITEMIAGTIEGMIAGEEEDIAEVTETITDKIVEETPDVIAIIVIEARIESVIDPGIEVETVAGIGAETAAGIDPATTAIGGQGKTRIGPEIDPPMKQNFLVTGMKLKLQKKFPSSSVHIKRLKKGHHQCNIQENLAILMYLDLSVLGNQNHPAMMTSFHFEQSNIEFGRFSMNCIEQLCNFFHNFSTLCLRIFFYLVYSLHSRLISFLISKSPYISNFC